MKNTKDNIKFSIIAADVVLFTVRDNTLFVRLSKVDRPPHFPGIPGIPGGLISPTETAEEAVERLISEKAGIDSSKVYYEQLYTFSGVNRDPRGRVVSVAYIALIPWEALSRNEQTDTKNLWWESAHKTPKLAYDHDSVLSVAIKRLRFQIVHTTISSKLVTKEFTLTHLEKICETILAKQIDKRNFRKKLLSLKVLKKQDRQLRGVKHRPANLYSFTSSKIKDLTVI